MLVNTVTDFVSQASFAICQYNYLRTLPVYPLPLKSPPVMAFTFATCLNSKTSHPPPPPPRLSRACRFSDQTLYVFLMIPYAIHERTRPTLYDLIPAVMPTELILNFSPSISFHHYLGTHFVNILIYFAVWYLAVRSPLTRRWNCAVS
jgi:hypothetical protein